MVPRRIGKGREEINILCPKAVLNYTMSMEEVNLVDQNTKYYGIVWISRRLWKYVFHFVLSVAIMNSFILYAQANKPACISHENSQLQCRISLMKQLTVKCSYSRWLRESEVLCVAQPHPKHFTDFLCLIKHHTMKMYWESGGRALHV
jgi:hypothetical protein